MDGGENAVAIAAGGFEVGGFEGEAMAFTGAGVGVESEVEPPGSVVVPEVMVGVAFGAAVGEVVFGGHGYNFGLVFYKAPGVG